MPLIDGAGIFENHVAPFPAKSPVLRVSDLQIWFSGKEDRLSVNIRSV
jgi:hypothetical protein